MNWRDTPHTRKLFSIIKISFQSTAQTSPERTDARRLGYGYRKKREKRVKIKMKKLSKTCWGRLMRANIRRICGGLATPQFKKKNDKKKMTVLG